MSINIIGNTAFSLGIWYLSKPWGIHRVAGLTLDLTNISNTRIQDIEKIDITGSGNNTLILNLNDLFDASTSTNILKV
jgi:hypothetical protein